MRKSYGSRAINGTHDLGLGRIMARLRTQASARDQRSRTTGRATTATTCRVGSSRYRAAALRCRRGGRCARPLARPDVRRERVGVGIQRLRKPGRRDLDDALDSRPCPGPLQRRLHRRRARPQPRCQERRNGLGLGMERPTDNSATVRGRTGELRYASAASPPARRCRAGATSASPSSNEPCGLGGSSASEALCGALARGGIQLPSAYDLRALSSRAA
jgi:hypothetical protein